MGKLWHLVFGLSAFILTDIQASPYDINNDNDGLSVELEAVLLTDPSRTDTDLDGFSDSEELARHTDPMNAMFYPAADDKESMYVAAEHRRGWIRLTAIAYLPPQKARQRLQFRTMEFRDDKLLQLAEEPLANLRTQVITQAAANSQGRIIIVSGEIADDWIYTEAQQTYAVTGEVEGKRFLAASVALSMNREVLYWQRPIYFMSEVRTGLQQPGCMSRLPQENSSMLSSSQAQEGSIYFPLDPKPEESEGVRDSICMQTSSPVGVQGGMIISEIITSECQSGWDGYCPASCASQVGSTYKTIDPLVLIGG